MAGAQTFMIMEGVRRAKAFDLAGLTTIPAIIQYDDGTTAGPLEVAIDSLRSPKATIDMSNNTQADRFWRVWKGLQAGQAQLIPEITITPGSQGVLIRDVGWTY